MLHPELQGLKSRLEAVGFVAVDHGDHLCVRLSLLCSVRLRYDGQRLMCEPRCGALSRTMASTLLFGVGTTTVTGFAFMGAPLSHLILAACNAHPRRGTHASARDARSQ